MRAATLAAPIHLSEESNPMLRKIAVSVLITLIASFAVTADAEAQVRRVPNTGCVGAPYPQPVGAPAIGQGFGVIAPQCRSANGQQFILIGLPARPVTLPVPPACARGCVLAVRPLNAVMGGAWRTLIPNDRRLIGACFRIQTGCIEATARGRCATLHGALDVCITR